MRDPEMFKYDVRVRERMLRAGRITTEEVSRVLDALPDLETSIESVTLNQPALELGATGASTVRQTFVSAPASGDGEGERQGEGDSE
jgi:hypothetical protein